jgi:hypothetical protein
VNSYTIWAVAAMCIFVGLRLIGWAMNPTYRPHTTQERVLAALSLLMWCPLFVFTVHGGVYTYSLIALCSTCSAWMYSRRAWQGNPRLDALRARIDERRRLRNNSG